ncbi:hypothetical protein M409DRAFT_69386 [Zasmidium cellare ATCC 36951]|uniref:Uncharacterized protein n=1 Tax=Zasmidium cellare ATCC 36951 TaxID=1080233 RepID=A0A6A6C8G7_ZASCE|nr:uncharacterized protein M409DRAFT_69386 [Zasmidium cellare ATCC 36951]KAF2162182.1 hypothetical protein M409DRAFT_69386 [Zasmidium cellare ATCC 36951]
MDNTHPPSDGSSRPPPQRDPVSESDLDPAAFLKSVRELSEKRDREDQERVRKLEEEVQKGREQRAARRLERARSISPDKQQTPASPAARPLSRTTTNASLHASPPVTMTPPSSSAEANGRNSAPEPEKSVAPEGRDVPDFKGFGSIKRSSTTSTTSAASNRDSASASTPSASNLARSGTLSWQQRPRPGSKLGGSRPSSMVLTGSKPVQERTDEPEPSRDQIAASLGARDPSWFKQTADRGIGSAAYRKSKDEAPSSENVMSGRRGLPGMSRESSADPESLGSPPMSDARSDLFTRGSSIRESTFSNSSSRDSATSTSSRKPDLKSLLAEDEDQQRASPSFDQASIASGDSGSVARTLTMSSSQARLTNVGDRPASPTKGVGGFVQSAMMKRSDSHNKRWSAQPGASLSRQNSVASARSGLGGLQGSHSMPKLEPTSTNRESKTESSSRPTSSSNGLGGLHLNTAQDDEKFVKPALPHHSRSKSVASNYSANDDGPSVPQSPGSPSKRWSPNKSSWLESSISRPESPKPAPSRNSQPSWMADLAKAKAQRASTDSTLYAAEAQKTVGDEGSRPGSPTKTTPFGQSVLKRSESKDLSQTTTPTNKLKPLRLADKFTTSPANPSPPASKPEETAASPPKPLGDPIDLEPKKGLTQTSTQLPDIPVESAKSPPPAVAEKPASLPKPEPETQSVKSPPLPSAEPTTPKTGRRSRSSTLKSPPINKSKAKPDTPPKMPTTDFRSQLKSRPRPESKPKDEPEFLSKFGNLRKTQQERYVAPDVLKDNIVRGKSGLANTTGPVKTERKDELKESLLAKKGDIQKAKEEGRDLPGQAHERKISGAPQAPSKPEALAKRELLGRSDCARSVQTTEKTREATPEALTRHKSLKEKSVSEAPPKVTPAPAQTPEQIPVQTPAPVQTPEPATAESTFQPLSRQTSESSSTETKPSLEKSKLAARFNPGLAGILARGPPSNRTSRPESPATPGRSVPQTTSSEPPKAGEPLQDVRKDRAKGPKRRKGATKATTSTPEPSSAPPADNEASVPPTKPKPPALPGSAASVMMASLNKTPRPISVGPYGQESEKAADPEKDEDTKATQAKAKPAALQGSAASIMRASLSKSPQPDKDFQEEEKPSTPTKPTFTRGAVDLQKPATPSKSPSLIGRGTFSPERSSNETASPSVVPAFKGFGPRRSTKGSQPEENKENSRDSIPSVKAAATQWGRRPSPPKSDGPSQIQLPTRKDEEAAMRSAGLLASSPKKSGLGITVEKNGDQPSPPASAGLPPKPAKSSRTVSGQLAEASPNKGLTNGSPIPDQPSTATGSLLRTSFGTIPKYREPLAIDTQTVISPSQPVPETSKTLRKSVQLVAQDGALKSLAPQEEYTHYNESAYLCTHTSTNPKGVKTSQIYLWAGSRASESNVETANTAGKKLSKENGSASVQLVRQGMEPASFLHSMGGIFVTRRGGRDSATKQYMLCGRKHLGHIVFDEVDFAIDSLCAGFVFLVSYPVSLQQTKLYLWKGSSCSAEELSAARLAAMDLSETGEIIEVDGGVEFPSFLKVFGANTTKWNVPKVSDVWQSKAASPDKFKSRLFRIQQAEAKTGLLTTLWNRRPSWNSLSPARSPARDAEEVKVEAKETTPFTQEQLDVDGIYLLDAHSEVFILIGPLLASHPDRIRDTLLGQALLFASDYTIMSASLEDRRSIPKCSVLFSGVPRDVKMLFRHWDEGRGLWGTAGLMAGSASPSIGRDVKLMPLDEMLTEVCRD